MSAGAADARVLGLHVAPGPGGGAAGGESAPQRAAGSGMRRHVHLSCRRVLDSLDFRRRKSEYRADGQRKEVRCARVRLC